MADQAEALRQRFAAGPKQAKVWGVVSGKGGVGKSNVSANLAISLAKNGKKVLVFDLDIGMGNIDLLLGKASSKNIMDMLQHNIGIWDIIEQDKTGISHIAGGRNLSAIAMLDSSMMDHFFLQFTEAESVYDYIILDMGAGITEWSLGFILSCDEVLAVTTPEITSITDAYSMIKLITSKKHELPVSLIINRYETAAEGNAAAAKLKEVSERFLKKQLNVLGMIPYDSAVKESVKYQVPFVISSPTSPASRSLREIAGKLAGEPVIQQRTSFFSRLRTFLKER